MLSEILRFNLYFLRDPDRIVHKPEEVIVFEVYAWLVHSF